MRVATVLLCIKLVQPASAQNSGQEQMQEFVDVMLECAAVTMIEDFLIINKLISEPKNAQTPLGNALRHGLEQGQQLKFGNSRSDRAQTEAVKAMSVDPDVTTAAATGLVALQTTRRTKQLGYAALSNADLIKDHDEAKRRHLDFKVQHASVLAECDVVFRALR